MGKRLTSKGFPTSTAVAILIAAAVVWWALGGRKWLRKDDVSATETCRYCGGTAFRWVPLSNGGTFTNCGDCGRYWSMKKPTTREAREVRWTLRRAGCRSPGEKATLKSIEALKAERRQR